MKGIRLCNDCNSNFKRSEIATAADGSLANYFIA